MQCIPGGLCSTLASCNLQKLKHFSFGFISFLFITSELLQCKVLYEKCCFLTLQCNNPAGTSDYYGGSLTIFHQHYPGRRKFTCMGEGGSGH